MYNQLFSVSEWQVFMLLYSDFNMDYCYEKNHPVVFVLKYYRLPRIKMSIFGQTINITEKIIV